MILSLEAGAGLSGCEVRTFVDLSGVRGGAIFSVCGTYRYLLWRCWAPASRSLLGWVMLNPSTADERDLDPTLIRCRRRAFDRLAGGMVVANLFALRSTDPAALRTHAEPIGPENAEALRILARIASPVVCGWGASQPFRRDAVVVESFREAGIDLQCLGTTKEGHPRHPLYVPFASGLRPF